MVSIQMMTVQAFKISLISTYLRNFSSEIKGFRLAAICAEVSKKCINFLANENSII
jgi:hypothetical protein